MIRSPRIGLLFLCLFLCLPTLYGQGTCNMNTITGTYAFNFVGSSAIVSGVAPDTFHWTALYAPIAGVGVFTVKPDGSAAGHYWMIAGAWNLGLTPTPWRATFTFTGDCIGELEYKFGEALLKERFVVLDNGRELRSVGMQAAVPTGAWITTARRIDSSCGKSHVRGQYLMSCRGLNPLDSAGVFSSAGLVTLAVAHDGSWTGTMYTKRGPVYGEAPIAGSLTVHDDCTAEAVATSPAIPGFKNIARAVFFNQGAEAYLIPLLLYPGPVPQPFDYCEVKRIAP